jgi:hypothetical protein
MSFPKILLVLVLVLFGVIGVLAWNKRAATQTAVTAPKGSEEVQWIELETEEAAPQAHEVIKSASPAKQLSKTPIEDDLSRQEVDRIDELFNLGAPQLPIVETIVYSSRVPWLQGRQAWIVDYASHYATSRHFIARSLNKKPDYITQNVADGDRFNVLKRDRDIRFYLLLDLSRCKLWFYSLDGNKRTLLKTYKTGLGRLDSRSASGSLTPLGRYTLGSKVSVFRPGMMGPYQNRSVEMVRVFGTRWIPFDQEAGVCTAPPKGYGLHGAPWMESSSGGLVEDRECLSKYDSDGCVRLAKEDIEEIFAIVITKPTIIEIVRDVAEVQLPGHE